MEGNYKPWIFLKSNYLFSGNLRKKINFDPRTMNVLFCKKSKFSDLYIIKIMTFSKFAKKDILLPDSC